MLEWHGAEARVGAVTFAVEEGELFGFDQHMDAIGFRHGGEIETFGDFQGLQHGKAGRVRRRLGNLIAAIGDRDRGGDFSLAGGEIGQGNQHAPISHAGGNPFGERAAVECFGAVRCNFAERGSKFRLHHDIAKAFADEHAGAQRIARQDCAIGFSNFGVAVGNCVAIPREGNC